MIGCIIQARMGSSRLPGKVMMHIDEENPVIYYVIKQLQHCKLIDEIVIATTTLNEDDVIEKYAASIGIICYRGNQNDVLDRYYQCAKVFSFSSIVRVTSDCPLIDPTIVYSVIQKFKLNSYDYVSNFIPRTFPFGTEAEIFSFQCLASTWENAKKKSEREHVTPYIYNAENKYRIGSITNSTNLSHLKWSIDRLNDLKLIRYIISKITKRPILMKDVLDLYAQKPELTKVNDDHQPDEGYKKSISND